MEPALILVSVGSLLMLGAAVGAWVAALHLRAREQRVARAKREVVFQLWRLRQMRLHQPDPADDDATGIGEF